MISNVTVLGASGRMGQAQVRELAQQGYVPRAVTRNAEIFKRDEFRGVWVEPADYDDPHSLDRVFSQADAAFFQPPSMADRGHVWRQCENIRDAACRAGLKRFVLNSTMWAPDAPPCGEPLYDHVRAVEDLFQESGLPLVVFRPVLFMDNLLTVFAKPTLVREGVYRYCHRPGLKADWIAMSDVALFMIEALKRDELIGRRIAIGGPETLLIEDVLSILSEVLGRPIRHEFISPRAFGERMHDIFGAALGVDRGAYGAFFDSFYSFNNYSEHRPFEVDMKPVLASIPLQLTRLRDWALEQDWSLQEERPTVGSITG